MSIIYLYQNTTAQFLRSTENVISYINGVVYIIRIAVRAVFATDLTVIIILEFNLTLALPGSVIQSFCFDNMTKELRLYEM